MLPEVRRTTEIRIPRYIQRSPDGAKFRSEKPVSGDTTNVRNRLFTTFPNKLSCKENRIPRLQAKPIFSYKLLSETGGSSANLLKRQAAGPKRWRATSDRNGRGSMTSSSGRKTKSDSAFVACKTFVTIERLNFFNIISAKLTYFKQRTLTAGTGGGGYSLFTSLGLMILVLYFFMWRPNRSDVTDKAHSGRP